MLLLPGYRGRRAQPKLEKRRLQGSDVPDSETDSYCYRAHRPVMMRIRVSSLGDCRGRAGSVSIDLGVQALEAVRGAQSGPVEFGLPVELDPHRQR